MEGRQRVSQLVKLPDVLRELGQDPAEILARAGIDPDRLQNAENGLTFVEYDRLHKICVAATQCEHFGLLVGQRTVTADFGLVGQLMLTAPTLKDAMLDLSTNQPRYIQGSVIYLIVEDNVAFWGYAVHQPGLQSIDQICDVAIAAAYRMFTELVGAKPDEVLIARQAPRDTRPYVRLFGSMPRFNAQQCALAFPARFLDYPVRTADPALRQALKRSVDDYWAVKQPSVTDAVSRLLRARVIFPDCSLEEIAGELLLQPRTLNRRLQAEGRTFRELTNEARFEVAQQLLTGTRMDITNVALALGYADPSGFTHAFQRWSGVAPSEWRK
jgi:AraC-like DNA-binding protein